MDTPVKPRWSMDLMTRLTCQDCRNEWVQPARTGRCPKCHSENTVTGDTRVNALPRV